MSDRATPFSPFAILFCAALAAQEPNQEPGQEPAVPEVKGVNTAISLGGSLGGLYGGRGGAARRPFANEIALALGWLARAQGEDGTLPAPRERVFGTTSLALLAWLGQGSTMRSGPHKEQIKKGIAWLRDLQHQNGFFGRGNDALALRDHALATLAMVEAHGLSKYRLIQPAAQRGVDWLLAQRTDDGVWGPDAATTAWAVIVCRSARDFGLEVPEDVMPRAIVWLRAAKADDVETAGALLLARRFAGDEGVEHDAAVLVDRIVKSRPRWEPGAIDAKAWFFATYAVFQEGGVAWRDWCDALVPKIGRQQVKSGDEAGSWDVGVEGKAQRAEATAMLALILEAGHRYMRLVR